MSRAGRDNGSWCPAWGHSALTRAGEGKTNGEGAAVDHGSKEARMEEGQEDRR